MSNSFFINYFLTNFLTFYDFRITARYVFSIQNITKIDMKKCQNRQNRETRTQNFPLSNYGGRQVVRKFAITTNAKFLKLNLILLIDQLRPAQGDERWW